MTGQHVFDVILTCNKIQNDDVYKHLTVKGVITLRVILLRQEKKKKMTVIYKGVLHEDLIV